MADFRRSIIVLAALALLLGTISAVSAANLPLSCIASGANPTQLRSEGLTELTGNVLITCTGGIPTDPGPPNVVPTSNIQIFLNTSLTSRLLNATTNSSEALLLVDEPSPAQQKVCPVTIPATNCGMYGQGASTADPYLGLGTATAVTGGPPYNVFQGQQVTSGSVTFNGIPIDAPGTEGPELILRVVNIRANANGLGVTSVNAPPISVTATISTSGTATLTITNNAQQVVGQVQVGLVISNTPLTTFQQCNSTNPWGLAGTITFAKGFAASFKVQNVSGVPGVLDAQDVPGDIYLAFPPGLAGVETGFYNPAYPAGVTDAGAADYGTRLRIIFAGLQAGVTVWVPNNVSYWDGTVTANPCVPGGSVAGITALDCGAALDQGLYAQLITSENGPYTAATANSSAPFPTGFDSITVSSTGTGEADYEVLSVKNAALQENLAIPFYISYTANPGANSPGLGTATVGGSFAPVSTDTSASATDTIPRFADTSVATNAFSIVKCASHLLFPFVTNQANYDTGMAISNTSMDEYGTSTQTGTCTFNFFGAAAPAAFTTPTAVAPGTTYTNLASALAPGFQGYIIVDCQFQYSHGFAFITQVGTFLGTEGYLALIIPDPPSPRLAAFPTPGVGGEQLSN